MGRRQPEAVRGPGGSGWERPDEGSECAACDGRGHYGGLPCDICDGDGVMPSTRPRVRKAEVELGRAADNGTEGNYAPAWIGEGRADNSAGLGSDGDDGYEVESADSQPEDEPYDAIEFDDEPSGSEFFDVIKAYARALSGGRPVGPTTNVMHLTAAMTMAVVLKG